MIIFKKVSYENFLSTGKTPITINLDNTHILLIKGKNAAGKTTILLAIYYALYGKAFSGVNLVSLINAVNKKGTLVTLELEINGINYRIRRGMKPNIFEIYVNGKLKPQNASVKDYQLWFQNDVLKMSEKTFRQVVTMGSTSFIPFMQLTANERRIVIEDLLDIDIISSMNMIAKERNKGLENTYDKTKTVLETLSFSLKTLKESSQVIAQNLQDSIERINRELVSLKEKAQSIIQDIQVLHKKTNPDLYHQLQEKRNRITACVSDGERLLYKNQQLLKKLQNEIDFFQHNKVCPTCTQVLDSSFITEQCKALMEKTNSVNEKITDIKASISKLNDKAKEIQRIMDEMFEIQTQLSKKYEQADKVKQQIQFYINEKESYEQKSQSKDDDLNIRIAETEENIKKNTDILNSLKSKLKSYDTILKLLKDDGIKTIIIKNYIGIINALIKKYLNIIDFNVSFTFDNNFNATIKSRGRDIFEYKSFSEGERSRIDFCLLFAFRELAKLRATVSTNLIIVDEQDGKLDRSGNSAINMLFKSMENSNIIIISQYPELYEDIVDRQILMEKSQHFTHAISINS